MSTNNFLANSRTFQLDMAPFRCRALVLLDVLMTISPRCSSTCSVISARFSLGGPIILMAYIFWNSSSWFLEKPLSNTTTIFAHCSRIQEQEHGISTVTIVLKAITLYFLHSTIIVGRVHVKTHHKINSLNYI